MLRAFLLFVLCGWGFGALAQPYREVYLQDNSMSLPVREPATTIFLTFDDGPSPGVTLPVADVLTDFSVLATFFVIGNKSVTSNGRTTLARLVRDGHLIANHTWAHETRFRTEAAFERSILRTTSALEDFLPASNLVFFRTPGGVWNRDRARWANRTRAGGLDSEFAQYVGPIFWNAGGSLQGRRGARSNAADWQCWSQGVSVRECADGYLARIRANHAAGDPSVVLMHDLRIQTRQLLIYVLEGLASDRVDWQFKRLDMARWPFSHPSS